MFTISIIKAELNLDYDFHFQIQMNVKKDNDYENFNLYKADIVKNFDNENLLLTTGEFRYRDHVQDTITKKYC